MKLTESQARRAIKKWLFEFATDSGVSRRPSTDDKIAGKLGDDREDQPAALIPQETPIMATSQMSTQLTHEMPPIEDPDFIPGTSEELGRSADLLSQQVPYNQLEWFYDKLKELADEAVEKGNSIDLSDGFLDDNKNIKSQIRPSQKSSEDAAAATNENWKSWSKLLGESYYNKPGKMTTRMRKKQLTRSDMRLYRPDDEFSEMEDEMDGALEDTSSSSSTVSSRGGQKSQKLGPSGQVVDGKYHPSQGDLEDMADAYDTDLDSLVGFNPRKHKTRAQRNAELAKGDFDGEAKLRELVDLGVYPKIRTMSGIRKKIAAEIDPIVQMWATAKPAFEWLFGWLEDRYQLTWQGRQIAGPDVYEMAIFAYEKFYRKNPAKLSQLADMIERCEFYKEAMAEMVLAPVIKKGVQHVKLCKIDVSSSKAKYNFIMSDWILETVLNSGFGKSGNKRRAKKV